MGELFNQMQLTIMLFESQAEQFIKKSKEYKIKEIEERLNYLYDHEKSRQVFEEIDELKKQLKELQGEK